MNSFSSKWSSLILVHRFCFGFLRAFCHSFFYKAYQVLLGARIFSVHLWWSFCIPRPSVRWNKYLEVFGHSRALFFHSPNCCFSSSMFLDILLRPQLIGTWCCLPFGHLRGPHVSVWRLFLAWGECEPCPWIGQISWPINVPIIIEAAFLRNI